MVDSSRNQQETNIGWKQSNLPPIIIWDTETTGLAPRENRMIEIGLMELPCTSPYRNVFTFSSLIYPTGLPQPRAKTRLHGITNTMMQDAPEFSEVWLAVKEFVDHISVKRGTPILVAHNLAFDKGFLEQELKRIGEFLPDWDFACSLRDVAHILWPGEPASLAALTEKFQITNHQAHRALSDVIATSEFLGKADEFMQQNWKLDGKKFLKPGQEIRNMIQNAAKRRRSFAVSKRLSERGFYKNWTKESHINSSLPQSFEMVPLPSFYSSKNLEDEKAIVRTRQSRMQSKNETVGSRNSQKNSFSDASSRTEKNTVYVALKSRKWHIYENCFSINRSAKISKLSKKNQETKKLSQCRHCKSRDLQKRIINTE